MITIERPGLRLRHGPAWLQSHGVGTEGLRQRLLQEVPWEQPLVRVYGKQHPTPRLTCWMADPGCSYRYSGQVQPITCLLYTSPSPRDRQKSRMPSSA